ncbi:MAG: hypothetical protein JXL80_12700 [Planctomycetes bacterium]|nr:hypothetical protein [Planctomycetota bacterium]
MNGQNEMAGAGGTGTPQQGMAGEPQTPRKSNKTGWILLICGIGCLGMMVLLAIVAVFFGAFAFRATRSKTVSAPRAPTVMASRAYPYAEHCNTWSMSGAPVADRAFSEAIKEYVFTNHGQQATNDLGQINWFKADCPQQTATAAGNVTVTLSNDAGQQVVLEMSFKQNTPIHWTFTVDSITRP